MLLQQKATRTRIKSHPAPQGKKVGGDLDAKIPTSHEMLLFLSLLGNNVEHLAQRAIKIEFHRVPINRFWMQATKYLPKSKIIQIATLRCTFNYIYVTCVNLYQLCNIIITQTMHFAHMLPLRRAC